MGAGAVQSLARPGGNITGLTVAVGPEFAAKRLELLKAMLPGVSHVAFLARCHLPGTGTGWRPALSHSAQRAPCASKNSRVC